MRGIQVDPSSPDISIRLVVGDQQLRVSKIGPSRMVLVDPTDSPATEAQLVIIVNGRQRSRNVRLPEGLDSASNVAIYY
jgi:hypothetical protein